MKQGVAEYETLVGDVHDLRAFALTADLRSLTAAARLTGESKATVSRRISRLEAALGVSLLRRSPRLVELTDDGSSYRVRVAQILELLGDANAAVRQTQAAPSGQLRLTTPPSFESVLAPIIARFVAAFPSVSVSALVTDRFVDLETEHLDVALRATRKLADSSLVAHRLMDIEQVLAAAPAYLTARGTPRRPDELAAHAFVQLGAPRPVVTLVVHRRDGAGEPTEVRIAAATSATDVSFVKELCVAGAGVALLPRLVAQREFDDGRLVHLLRPYAVHGAALYFVHRGGRFVPPKVRAFREFLQRECAGSPPPPAPHRR